VDDGASDRQPKEFTLGLARAFLGESGNPRDPPASPLYADLHVHGSDGAGGLADGGGEAPDATWLGVQFDAHGDGVGGVGCGQAAPWWCGARSVLPGRRL
jgi:hypothetical protein